MQMTQSSAHRQQGMKNMRNNHHDEEAVVLPKGHYLQEASNISKTTGGKECQKATDDKTGLLAHTLSFDTTKHSHEACCAVVMYSQAKFIFSSMQGGGNNLLTFLNMQRESLL